MNFPTASKEKESEMLKLLQNLLIFITVIAVTEAQMTQTKFKKHFVVKSSWLQPQKANNTIRYEVT